MTESDEPTAGPDEPTAEPDEPTAGPADSLGEQAQRIVSLVQDWAARTFPVAPDGHAASNCEWCPICQFLSVLRGERPEVTERVAEAGTALVSAFRALLDAAAPEAGTQAPAPGEPRPRVQRIDLDADSSDAG